MWEADPEMMFLLRHQHQCQPPLQLAKRLFEGYTPKSPGTVNNDVYMCKYLHVYIYIYVFLIISEKTKIKINIFV